MKALVLLSLTATLATSLHGEDAAQDVTRAIPKNLARHHLGAQVSRFDAKRQTYVPVQVAAEWLDDDVATGRAPEAGQQFYLLSIRDTQVVTNFTISALPMEGTVNLYTGMEPATPGSPAWKVAAKSVSLTDVNHKKLSTPINRTAKYLLIETNITEPAPIYSLYTYGEAASVDYHIAQRAEKVRVRDVAGEFVNERLSFSLSSVYGRATVTSSNSDTSSATWIRAIDDNPESTLNIASTEDEAGLVVQLQEARPVVRVSALVVGAPKGTLEMFFRGNEEAETSLKDREPVASIELNGSTDRGSADFPATDTRSIALRWKPTDGSEALVIRELNTFADLSLGEYELVGAPRLARKGSDGKELLPIGEGPEENSQGPNQSTTSGLSPIGSGPIGGFVPGNLGFPPNFREFPTGVLPPVSPK